MAVEATLGQNTKAFERSHMWQRGLIWLRGKLRGGVNLLADLAFGQSDLSYISSYILRSFTPYVNIPYADSLDG